MSSATQRSARDQQREDYVNQHKEHTELDELKRKNEALEKSQKTLAGKVDDMAGEVKRIEAARENRDKELSDKVSQLEDTIQRPQQPASGRTRCVESSTVRAVNKYVRCAIEFCTGSSQPEPFPRDGSVWPLAGNRRLMRWNFEQNYNSEVNRAQTEQLWDVMTNNPSAINLPTWLPLEKIPSVGTHVDLYKDACQQYFHQLKATLKQREDHDWVNGGREKHEELMEERRKAGASETECRELEARKVKMEIRTGNAQSDPLVRRGKRSKMQTVSQVVAQWAANTHR